MSKPLMLEKLVLENLQVLKGLSESHIAKIINLRAGRLPRIDPSAQTIINQFNLIESEIAEGKEAAAKGDLDGVRDAVCDIVLLAYGQEGHIAGLDLSRDYTLMCAFNMTRIPTTIEEAKATQEKYKKIGIETNISTLYLQRPEFEGYLYPVLCLDKDQWDTAGNHYPPRKFVKSVNFIDARFEPILDETGKDLIKIDTNNGQLTGVGELITPTMVDKFVEVLMDSFAPGVKNPMNEADFIKQLHEKLDGVRV